VCWHFSPYSGHTSSMRRHWAVEDSEMYVAAMEYPYRLCGAVRCRRFAIELAWGRASRRARARQ
jgi:hypothetical protein